MPPGVQSWSVFGTIGLNGLGKSKAQLAAFDAAGRKTGATVLGLKGKSLAAAGAIAAIGTASAIVAGKSVAHFASFDEKMTQSLAIMGDVSEAMEGRMADAARDVGLTTQFSAEQAAEAYFFLASAGLSAEQAIGAMPQVSAFAQAGQFDLALATDLLTDAQSALGLTVDDTAQNMLNMGRVSDVLVKANTLANASVEQFSTALTTQAGAALKAFDKDVEEGVAVLAAMADQGVKAQRAGSGLSRIIRLMTQAANNNKDAFDELGFSVFDAEGKMRNFADIVENLEEITADMTDEQKSASLEMLGFTARVQQVILPLLGTSDAIREYERELRSAGGTTEDVSEKQMDTLNKQMGLLKAEIGDAALELGGFIEPSVTDFVKDLRKEVRGLGNAFRALGDAAEEAGFGVEDFNESAATGAAQGSMAVADAFKRQRAEAAKTLEQYEQLGDWWAEQRATAQYDELGETWAEMWRNGRGEGGGGGGGEGDGAAPASFSGIGQDSLDLMRARRGAGEGVLDVIQDILSVEGQINAKLRERANLTTRQEADLLSQQTRMREEFSRFVADTNRSAPIPGADQATTPGPIADMSVGQLDPDALKPATKAGGKAAEAMSEGAIDQQALMQQAGMHLIQGLASGSFDAGEFLKSTMLQIASSFIMGPLSGFFAFGSPSKLMADRGRDIVLGLAGGIRSAGPSAEEAMMGVARRVAGVGFRASVRGRPALPATRDIGGGLHGARPGRLRFDGPDIPPPTDPRQAARDREWQKMFRESSIVAESQGFRGGR